MTSAYRPEAGDVTEATLKGVGHLHLTSIGDPALCGRVVDAARTCRGTASLDIERADCPEDAAALLDAIKGFDLIFCNAESRLLRMRRSSARLRVSPPRSSPRSARTGPRSRPRRGASPRRASRRGSSTQPARAIVSPPPACMPALPRDWTGARPFASPTAPRRSQRQDWAPNSALPTAAQVAAHLQAELNGS